MKRKDTATLSSKFQISIPKAIRLARRWQAGQVFAFIPKGEGMMLGPVPAREELAGLARGAGRKITGAGPTRLDAGCRYLGEDRMADRFGMGRFVGDRTA